MFEFSATKEPSLGSSRINLTFPGGGESPKKSFTGSLVEFNKIMVEIAVEIDFCRDSSDEFA